MTTYILYSADYELFLGGNYCDETEVLIDPTNDLLDVCDTAKIPLTLFADIFSLLRYKEHNLTSFPDHAEKQLKDTIRRGHDVQSHVHPHWNYTSIQGKTYRVNTDFFLLGNLDTDKEILYSKIRYYLTTSMQYLQNLLHPVNNTYQCVAFRSGGYGIQPNSDILLKALTDSGFLIDSSVVPGFVFKGSVNQIDFSNVPVMANYYLDHDVNTPSQKNQGIFEIPIASCEFGHWENSFLRFKFFMQKFLKNNFSSEKSMNSKEKGYPIQLKTTMQTENITNISRYNLFFRNSYNEVLYEKFMYLDCTRNPESMFLCTKKYLKQFDSGNQDIFFSFNMHPKVMTPEHFQALEKYHKKLTGHYKGTIQAISFQQAAAMLRRNLLNDNDVNVANNVSTQKEVFLNFQMTRTKRINQEMYEALKKI